MIDWLPGADLSQRFDAKYPGVRMPRVYKLVLHTTETTGWPGYGDDGRTAPNITARWDGKRLAVRQHLPLHSSARALQNAPGGVGTNDQCVQVELVGTCDETFYLANVGRGAVLWPRAPFAAKQAVRDLIRAICAATNVPLQSSVRWKPYAGGRIGGSSGANNGVRLTSAQWATYRGILGHQHVPEGNKHGDPGDIDIAFLLAPPETQREGDPLAALSDQQQRELHEWVGRLNEIVPLVHDLHDFMDAVKAGRTDTEITADEVASSGALTRDDIPDVASGIADELTDRLDK